MTKLTIKGHKKRDKEVKEETMEKNAEQFNAEQLLIYIPNGYEFFGINDDNKIVLVKKKIQFKTYKECCKIVGANPCIRLAYDLTDGKTYSHDLDNLQHYNNLRRLLICRDAYWKIAGEQMGLDNPWSPDWTDNNQKKWIINFYQGEINLTNGTNVHFVLAFPTEEMRDAFYENFKDLIETCKELI